MQFTISGIFQKYEQAPFGLPTSEIPRSFRRKLNAFIHSPLTFVILVWAMMFFFASLYFVYAQEVKLHRNNAQSAHQKTHTAVKSKTGVKKLPASARKTESVEVFSVGPETLNTDFSRQAIAGDTKPNQ